MKAITALLCLGALLSACSTSTPAPTPDARATETKIASNIFATQTANVPTAIPTVTQTPSPHSSMTPTVSNTPAPSLTPSSIPTPSLTRAPSRVPTSTPAPTPVLQDQTVQLVDKWDVTLISVRRDKTIWGLFGPETAFGVWGTFLFRVRNLQSGSDYLAKSFGFQARADDRPIEYTLFNTVEDKAQWFYSCCQTAYALVHPGQEQVVLITFDLPEDARSVKFNFTLGKLQTNMGSSPLPIHPTFLVPVFDQIPPRKSN